MKGDLNMKTVKKILIITLAVILTLATTLNVFAVDSSEIPAESEIIISESTKQPQEQIILEETTVPDTTETATPDISEKIYGINLNPDKIFMLPNDTFQLEVGFLTSPPEPTLRTEFIEEEATEVLVTEAQTDEELTEASETTTEIQEETTKAEEETTVIAEESTTYPEEITETTIAESETETETATEHTTVAETEEHTEISEVVTDTQTEAYAENISGIISDSELTLEPITEEENETLDLIWSSSDEAVAAIGLNGLIYSRELGTATVTASTPDGVFSASCEVNVVEEIPEENENSVMSLDADYRVALSPNTSWSAKPGHWAVKVSTEFTLNFDVYKCDPSGNYEGDEGDISSLVNWQSSDTSVATVDIYGRVTGLNEGSTTITVSAKNGDNILVYNPIHVTVYTSYSSTRSGISKSWVNQYKSTVIDCHSDRLAGMVSPGTSLNLYGTSGGYILGSVQGQTVQYFLWASNIYDQTNGTVTICKSGATSDTRRHWDMYTTQTVSLALTNGASAAWTTSDSSIAKVSGYTTYTGKTVTINPVAEGTAYITANSGGKIDIIHVTVITRCTDKNNNPINEMGVTISWCGKYKCSHTNCTIIDRKEGDTEPNKLVRIYGKSGGFYYANVIGENTYIYMWKENVKMQSWYRQCELENAENSSDKIYSPQGFAVDSNYCYSFEVSGTAYAEESHRLYRYNINTGDLTEMSNNNVKNLWHANDAAIVEFTENGVSVPYLFVAAYSKSKPNYIVKLAFDSSAGYKEVARYPFSNNDFQFVGLTKISGGKTEPAVFLLKNANQFYTVTISNSLANGEKLTPVLKFSIDFVSGYASQGTHYDYNTDTLYIAFSSGSNLNENLIHSYTGIRNASGTLSSIGTWEISKGINTKITFEVEGIGFSSDSTDSPLWFLTYEKDETNIQNGGIYTDSEATKTTLEVN